MDDPAHVDQNDSGLTSDQARSRALTRQANALRADGCWQEALPLSFEALRADQANAAAAHNLGVLLAKVGRLAEGELATRHALALAPHSPMIAHALAHNLLAQGRYEEGWALYEVRAMMPELETGFPIDFAFPRWRGEPLAGKRLALFPEQGLGDQIQFARFIPQLLQEAAEVILLTGPQLERLFRHNFPDATLVVATGDVEFPDPDYWTTLHDLPSVLKIGLANVPGAPYLRAPGTWPSLGEGFKVGLKTKGNPKHINDRLRSLSEEDVATLRSGMPGTVISLEPQDSGASDMADTAAIIDQLDLVVSVDTSVAHLAGAMGKPCLLLVAGFSPDWRWMVGRDDSPWYPQHRLYRGEIDGNWRPAIERLIAEAHARAPNLAVPEPIMPAPTVKAPLATLMYRASALREEARFPEALDLMRRALRIAPANAGALNILGTMLGDIGRLSEAEQYQRRALARAPDYSAFRYSLALTLLRQGRYAEAWPLYEARQHVPSVAIGFPTGLPCPRWRGEALAGKRLIVMPEQGFGDQIQFVRFVPWLQQQGAQVTLFVRPELVALFRSSLPGVTVQSAEGQARLGNPDYWTTLVDMAQPLGITLETLPKTPTAYLKTDRSWPDVAAGFTIGVRTRGSDVHANDAWRSLSDKDAARLRACLPGTLVDLDPQLTGAADFADSAALIARLDLIVSVDTSVAHLAGALGKSCLLLIPGVATDWRWLRDRRDSAWYPQHRLYRGALDGNWTDAIDRLCADANSIATGGASAAALDAPELGRRAKALASARTAAAADPTAVLPLRHLGVLLTETGALREGEAALAQALALGGAEAERVRYDLALNLLGQGRYREGWKFYGARRGLSHLNIGYPRGVGGPRWEGQPLAGKRLLILAEQGIGDTLQLARYLPVLSARGATITLIERAPLLALLRSAFPSVTVLDVTQLAAMGPQDYWTTTFDMLEPLDVTLETLPPADYLAAAGRLADGHAGVTVGLCTTGNPRHTNDQQRSLSARMAKQLHDRLPASIIDLAPEKTGARDFAGTAARMAQMDLIVSVDTAVAHLAGVLGKPCLLLVPGFATDWRWMRDRDDSPWYPQHRLFRSTLDGNWDAAIDALVAEAHVLAVANGHAPALP